jgi:NifU-like protein involved in Fe-S cluster formation
MYSEMVMEHFGNPSNTGVIEDADGAASSPTPGNQEAEERL